MLHYKINTVMSTTQTKPTTKPKSTTKPTTKPKKKRFKIKRKEGPTTEELVKEYQEQMEETEKIALKIAHRQLESSFCIEKSIGFLKFLEARQNKG